MFWGCKHAPCRRFINDSGTPDIELLFAEERRPTCVGDGLRQCAMALTARGMVLERPRPLNSTQRHGLFLNSTCNIGLSDIYVTWWEKR